MPEPPAAIPTSFLLIVNVAAQPVAAEYDEATESLTLPVVPIRPIDELTLTIGLASGSWLSKLDRRLERGGSEPGPPFRATGTL